ncbi:MAG: FumA C-terminus/TtdB family hydratase beta subunit [Candidatus Diapherotrites archaeon]
MIRLKTPLKGEEILKLNVGDNVLLSGTIFTARDKAHVFLLENDFDKVKDSVIYHCGPIIKDGKAVAAGPTTSSRMNPHTPKMIEKYGVKAIIGKGGMDNSVLGALKGKAIYFSALGGAAVIYAKAISVKGVDKEEFGMPEAIWEFEVKDFPVVVAMDAKGNSLYEKIYGESEKVFRKLIGQA